MTSTELAAFVEARLRRPPPPDCAVVVGSTPVISFGRFGSSKVATLGLNPSRQEFLDPSGIELSGPRRRFETLSSLGVSALQDAPYEALARVAGACDEYFERNPYRRWFDQLEPILQAVGASYYAGTACHLDLVQWATDPTWGSLSDARRGHLLREDVGFLVDQLANSQIGLLLVNGRAVWNFLANAASVTLEPASGAGKTSFAVGELGRVRVIAWSINIQSSFGVTVTARRDIAERVGELRVAGKHT